MSNPAPTVTVDVRVPGNWGSPKEMFEGIPDGYELVDDSLILPDGTRIDIGVMKADDRFAKIFRSSLRQPANDAELEVVDNYVANVLLSGPGGSLDAARKVMEAAGAIVKAGGAGVFIDNSGLSHGGEDWLVMTEDGSPDALSFAFVGIVRGDREVWTMGMHVLGLREILMKRDDIELGGFDIIEVIRYLSRGEKPIEDNHIIADEDATPRFQVRFEPSPQDRMAGTVMHNPFGRMRLVSLQDIAETN